MSSNLPVRITNLRSSIGIEQRTSNPQVARSSRVADINPCSSVNRAFGSGPKGRRFESCHGYHIPVAQWNRARRYERRFVAGSSPVGNIWGYGATVAYTAPTRQMGVQIFLPPFMVCWLNWYSTGSENRHSGRISGFESQAHRITP